MKQDRAIPTNVTLYEEDRADLIQIGKDFGLASISATVRFLLNDWKRLKAQQVHEERVPYVVEQA